MAILQKQVDYSKELDDVAVLLVALVKDVKAKKSLSEVAADALPKLMDAIAGVDQVAAEIAASRAVCAETVGYRLGELTDALLG